MAHRLSLALFVSGILVASCFAAPAAANASALPLSGALNSSTDLSTSGEDLVDADSAPTEELASELAAEFDHPVIVESSITETSIVRALPSGDMQLTSNSVPVRIFESGEWQPVDLDLKVSDGFVQPETPVVPVTFSDGGNGPMARVQAPSGEWVEETWPLGPLPVPVIDDSSATYREVLPGVDLVLSAKRAGMTEVLVIKSPAAATNPALETLSLGVSGVELTSADDGTISGLTAEGSEVTASQPTWWDSSDKTSSEYGPGGNVISRALDHEVDEDSLTLDTGSATDVQGITYPVYIDPDWTGHLIHHWYVDRAYPSQSYLDGNQAQGYMRVGYLSAGEAVDGRTHLARAFWRIDTSDLRGAKVTEAELSVTEMWSYSCSKSTAEIWRVGSLAAGAAWDETSSSVWAEYQDARYVAHGYSSSCPVASIGFNVLEAATWAAGNDKSFVNLGMRARDETSNVSWKRFDENAEVLFTYNRPPYVPTAMGFASPARGCGTYEEPVYVSSKQDLTLKATSTDRNPGAVKTTFFLYSVSPASGSTNPVYTRIGEYSTNAQAQGPATRVLREGQPDFVDGHYAFRARTTDSDGAFATDPGFCDFVVKNSGPPLPAITAPAGPFTVGQPVSVTLTSAPSDEVAAFGYWWVYGTKSSIAPAAPVTSGTVIDVPKNGESNGVARFVRTTGGTADVTVAPVDDDATLWIASYDKAGNVSSNGAASNAVSTVGKYFQSNYDEESFGTSKGHYWNFESVPSPLAASVADSNVTVGTGVDNSSAITLGPGAITDSTSNLANEELGTQQAVLSFPLSSSASVIKTSHQVIDTRQSFTIAAWLNPMEMAVSKRRIALSQSGANGSAVRIEVDAANRWRFCVTTQDGAAPALDEGCAIGPEATSGWVHITGTWDAANKQVRMYKGAEKPQIASASRVLLAAEPTATGSLSFGSELSAAGAPVASTAWIGSISSAGVWPGVISSTQRTNLRTQDQPNP